MIMHRETRHRLKRYLTVSRARTRLAVVVERRLSRREAPDPRSESRRPPFGRDGLLLPGSRGELYGILDKGAENCYD